jgi:transposase
MLKVEVIRWKNTTTGENFEQAPDFVRPYERMTRQLETMINDLSRFMTISDVAGYLNLGWDQVKGVVAKRLKKDYRRIGYRHLRFIGIDALYLGHIGKYVTIVIDMESGRIVWVGQGKGGSALREFWRRIKASGARVRGVAMDMSKAYVKSVREHVGDAIITFDRFHVIKLMNEKLDDLRRELVRTHSDPEAKKRIKGMRWLLLKRKDNLCKSAAQRLKECLKMNAELQCAYILKEELGLLWEQENGREGWDYLREWYAKAKASGIRQLKAMAKTLLKCAKGILSYYKTGLTSGKLEGINRKIRGLLMAVYGYRDHAFFKLKLYALHESKFALVG